MSDQFLEALGNVARKRRKAMRNVSQERLAELAGLHKNAVGMFERAEGSPEVLTARAIAHALGMSLVDLMAEAEAQMPKLGSSPSKSR